VILPVAFSVVNHLGSISLYASALLREHCKNRLGDVRSRDLGRQNAYKWPHTRKKNILQQATVAESHGK